MAQLKDSIVSGNLRVTDKTLTNALQATTINEVSVGSNPKFTDTVTSVTYSAGILTITKS